MEKATKHRLQLSKAEVTLACEQYARKHGALTQWEQLELVHLSSGNSQSNWLEAEIKVVVRSATRATGEALAQTSMPQQSARQ